MDNYQKEVDRAFNVFINVNEVVCLSCGWKGPEITAYNKSEGFLMDRPCGNCLKFTVVSQVRRVSNDGWL